ncbi:hypothetical protein DFS33DRAFT_778550 [Desarmillaria ectypa]|nr:hypothetical protein DFS33DRAFT_778550 [Desarmillaria ectypa]
MSSLCSCSLFFFFSYLQAELKVRHFEFLIALTVSRRLGSRMVTYVFALFCENFIVYEAVYFILGPPCRVCHRYKPFLLLTSYESGPTILI